MHPLGCWVENWAWRWLMWLTSFMRMTFEPCCGRASICPLFDQTNLKFAAVLRDRALKSKSWFSFVSCSTIRSGFFEFCLKPISAGNIDVFVRLTCRNCLFWSTERNLTWIVFGSGDLPLINRCLCVECTMPMSTGSKLLASDTPRCERIWLNFCTNCSLLGFSSRSTPLIIMFVLICCCSNEVPFSARSLDCVKSRNWFLRFSISDFRQEMLSFKSVFSAVSRTLHVVI